MENDLASSVEQLIGQLNQAKEEKTILFADMHNSTEFKMNRKDVEWVPVWGQFYKMAVQKIHENEGVIVKFIGDAVMAVFDDAGDALRAAIAIQEQIKDDMRGDSGGLPCKIGVATGAVYGYRTSDGKYDYLGSTVDTASRLCEQARGNAILLSIKTYQAADTTKVTSLAGRQSDREPEEYFGERLHFKGIKGFKEPLGYYNLFWQAQRGNYTAAEPAGETMTGRPVRPNPQGPRQGAEGAGQFLRGLVNRHMDVYGFLSFTANNGQRDEAYFHDSFSLCREPIKVNDVVYFLLRSSQEGKNQAHCLLKMGAQCQGRIGRLTAGGFTFINVQTDTPSCPAVFFAHASEIQDGIKEGDVVKFTISENRRGLMAVGIMPLEASDIASPQVA